MAGIKPISKALSVIVATNRGIVVTKDAKPRANPKKAPSMMLTSTLCFRFCANFGVSHAHCVPTAWQKPGVF